MTDEQNLLSNAKVKQTLTSVDEKYWYPFAYKVEQHHCKCDNCDHIEVSTLTYKIFAHYLYTEHTYAHKAVPVGARLDPRLPVHHVKVQSAMPVCDFCVGSASVPVEQTFESDQEWRAHLKAEGARRTAAARRDNELRAIFGGPPAKKVDPSKPKFDLNDFLKDL